MNATKLPEWIKIQLHPSAKMNKSVFTCIDCSFTAPRSNVIPYMLGIAPNTNWGPMVVWECPACFQLQFFHYHGGSIFDYAAGFVAYKFTSNITKATEAALHFRGKEWTENEIL